MNVKVNVKTHPDRAGSRFDWARIVIDEGLAIELNRLASALKAAKADEIVASDYFPAHGTLFWVHERTLDRESCALVVRKIGDFFWRGRSACCGIAWQTDYIPFAVLREFDLDRTEDLDLREHRDDRVDGKWT